MVLRPGLEHVFTSKNVCNANVCGSACYGATMFTCIDVVSIVLFAGARSNSLVAQDSSSQNHSREDHVNSGIPACNVQGASIIRSEPARRKHI